MYIVVCRVCSLVGCGRSIRAKCDWKRCIRFMRYVPWFVVVAES